MKRVFIVLVAAAVVLAATFVGRYFILSGAQPLTLPGSPYYAGVETALYAAGGKLYRPIDGKDYKISSTDYFDNNQWILVHISPLGGFSDSGVIILQKKGSSYQPVLGPSSESFSKSKLESDNLPSDLINYLAGGGS